MCSDCRVWGKEAPLQPLPGYSFSRSPRVQSSAASYVVLRTQTNFFPESFFIP